MNSKRKALSEVSFSNDFCSSYQCLEEGEPHLKYQVRYGYRSGQNRFAMVALLLFLAALCSGQIVRQNRIFNAPVDEKTGVRFFYQNDIKDHFYPPLIFRVVDKDDPRKSTAPLGPEGRQVFVTAPELQNLLQRLFQANIFWQESGSVEKFGPSYQAKGKGYLDITVASSKGTARSSIGRSEVCRLLELWTRVSIRLARYGNLKCTVGLTIAKFQDLILRNILITGNSREQ